MFVVVKLYTVTPVIMDFFSIVLISFPYAYTYITILSVFHTTTFSPNNMYQCLCCPPAWT